MPVEALLYVVIAIHRAPVLYRLAYVALALCKWLH